jgi:hypothetical protein
MNKEILEERSKRLLEVNKVIKELDASIRLAAFNLLEDYVTTGDPGRGKENANITDISNGKGREAFFSKFDTEKPADNAVLLAAHLYSYYGSVPFSMDEIKALAAEVGLIVPDRTDMTIRNAQRDGKNLFQSTGKGAFKPTVHGELFFKNTYNVIKGHRDKKAANPSG